MLKVAFDHGLSDPPRLRQLFISSVTKRSASLSTVPPLSQWFIVGQSSQTRPRRIGDIQCGSRGLGITELDG